MLFLELIFDRVRSGVAALPEGLNELIALFVRLHICRNARLLIADDGGLLLAVTSCMGYRFLLELFQVFDLSCGLSPFSYGIRLPFRREYLLFLALGHAARKNRSRLR